MLDHAPRHLYQLPTDRRDRRGRPRGGRGQAFNANEEVVVQHPDRKHTDGAYPRLLPGPGRYRSATPQTPTPWWNSVNRANPPCTVTASSVRSSVNPNTSLCRFMVVCGRTPVISAPTAADKVLSSSPNPYCFRGMWHHLKPDLRLAAKTWLWG